jgi:hypothetical protein
MDLKGALIGFIIALAVGLLVVLLIKGQVAPTFERALDIF